MWRFREIVDHVREFRRLQQRESLIALRRQLRNQPDISLADRISALAQVGQPFELDTALRQRLFSDVFAAFTPRGYKFVPRPDRCIVGVSQNAGPAIFVAGALHGSGVVACTLARTLFPSAQVAVHNLMDIRPTHRGSGLAVFVLMRSFEFFDRIGIRWVQVQAALGTGRWYWARCGFGFLDPGQRNAVDRWAVAVLIGLGLQYHYSTAAFTRPDQYALIGSADRATTSIGAIAGLMPVNPYGLDYRNVARDNGIAMDEPLELGRAILLTGPEWLGQLDLQGADRGVFDAYVHSRLRKIAHNM